jgi:uncharacterized protein YcaQ
LCGTQFIGRLDPKLDRENEEMIINSLSVNDKYVDRNHIDELVLSLRRFLKFHDASKVNFQKTKPEELKGILTRELGSA